MKIRNLLLAGTAIATLAGAGMARAAVLPHPQASAHKETVNVASTPFNWSGMYFGINGGYGSAASDTVDTITGNSAGANGTYPNSVYLNGFVGGGTIGANYQTGQLVLGIDGNWDWTNQSLTKSVSCTAGCVATGRSRINWFATLRGRVGYAVDRVLFYGTAGAALVNGQDIQTQTVPAGAPAVVFNDTALGWTAGAGVEYAINRNLSAKLEFSHISATLSQTVPFPTYGGMGGGVENERASISDNIIEGGFNWKF